MSKLMKRRQCVGTVPRTGERCRRPALPEDRLCNQHRRLSEPVPNHLCCTATTHEGTQCQRQAAPGEGVCGIHRARSAWNDDLDVGELH
jgi:hypothetical protein